MLFLYPKNTTDFTNNGDPIHHSYDEHVIRDDGFYLTFNLLLDKEEGYKKVKKEMIIGADTPDGPNQFRVYDVKKKNTHVEVTAVQLMYDFDNKEVNPFTIKNATGSQVITKFRSSFKSSLGQFTMDSSVSELHDFATNEAEDDTPSHNALEVLNRITSRWDSELMLNGFDIRMIKRLGQKTDALLYEKKNISEFEDSSSVSGMATRIHATSKFTPEGKENEVTLSVTVDSPLINEYAQIYEKSFVNNECRTEAELIAWVKLKYSTENIDKPSRSITVATNIIDGTEINYGDDLVLKYLVHDVDEVIRCVGYDYDPIRKTYYSVTLGDWKDSFLNTVTSNIVDSTNKQLNQMKKNVTHVLMAANGKNRNAYGPEPVPNPINGDQWYYFEFGRPNEVEFRVYQDGFWVKFDFFATKNEVEGALTEAEEAKQKAIESYNNAIADAATYTNTKAQEFDNKLVAVNQEVANVTQAANTAVAKADQAIQDVGFMQIDVNAAKTNAIEALTKAQEATENVNVLTTNFDELTQTVGLKAEKTAVDIIKNTVDQHSLNISANAQAINARLTSAQVETLLTGKKYVNETTLNATANGLSASITQVSSDLSNLEIGGRNLITGSGTKEYSTTANNLNGNAMNGVGRPMVEGETYTLSFDLKADSATTSARVFLNNGLSVNKNFDFTTEWRRHFVTFKYNGQLYLEQQIYPHFYPTGTMAKHVRRFKLEKGNKATDWTPAPEDMATLEKVTSIEANFDGLQATVASKADKTQVTQLSNQWTQTTNLVNGHTGQISNLATQINLRVTSAQVTEAILADKTIKDTRNVNNTPAWYNQNYARTSVFEFKTRTVIGVPGSSTFVQLTTKSPWVGSSGGEIVQVAESSDGTYQRNSTGGLAAWGPWEKIIEAGELISQINIQTGNIIIQTGKLYLDTTSTHMTTAYVNDLKAKSLEAVYADIATLKTKVLTADVITSTMVKSDTALITKLFATDANVNVLTAKTAFINSVKAVDIAADRITSGTFNGAKMNVINLNASSITSGQLNSALVTVYGGSANDYVRIQGSAITMRGTYTRTWDGITETATTNTMLKNGYLTFENIAGNKTLSISDYGISSGYQGGGSGAIEFFSNRHGMRGITIDSAGALDLTTTDGELYLNSKYKTAIRSNQSSIWFRPQSDVPSKQGDNAWSMGVADGSPSQAHGYFVYGSENEGSSTGIAFSKNAANPEIWLLGAREERRKVKVYAGEYRADKYMDYTAQYETYFNAKGNASFANNYALMANGVMTTVASSAFYVGTDNEMRVTNRYGHNNGNGITLKPIQASAFNVGSSREYKKGIENFKGKALDLISGTAVREYWLKDDNEKIDLKRVGLVVQESPVEIINLNGGTSIDTYAMTSLLWKGEQELLERIDVLEKKIKQLESAA